MFCCSRTLKNLDAVSEGNIIASLHLMSSLLLLEVSTQDAEVEEKLPGELQYSNLWQREEFGVIFDARCVFLTSMINV